MSDVGSNIARANDLARIHLEEFLGRAKAAPRKVDERGEWVAQPAAPAGAREPQMIHPHRGMPVELADGVPAVWRYFSAEGLLVGLVGRYAKSDGGKDVCPMTWCVHSKTGAMDSNGDGYATEAECVAVGATPWILPKA